MKFNLLILTFSLVFTNLLYSQADTKISWNYEGYPFSQFVSEAESRLNMRFFYKEEWVKDLRPDQYPGITSVTVMLDSLFKGKQLYYFISDSGYVIITKNYSLLPSGESEFKENKYIPIDLFDKDLIKNSEDLYIDIGDPADKNKPGNVNISGYITDRDTKESLSGATVISEILSSGAISNQYGFFSLNLPRGSHLIQFSFIGMKEKHVYVNLYGSGDLNIDMNTSLIPLKETVIYGQRNAILQRYEVGMVKVDMESVKLLPTPMGEPDITKSILLIPGVLSVGEGSVGFNVRGGSSDQNLMLLYGAPVYYPSHFFGFFTSVNADIIKDFTIYKGGIPARYGGRISSVIDITSRDGSRSEFKGNAGISPVATHFVVEGPIKKDRSAFILAGRTTYSNWVLNLINNPALRTSRASFYDLNASISYDINKNNKIDISSYLSHDSFRLNSDTVYSYDNNIASLRWRHNFTSRHFVLVTLNNSNFKYQISSDKAPKEAFTLAHRLNSTGLKADFNLYHGKNEIRYGLDMTLYSVLPGSFLPSNDSSIVIAKKIPIERALEGALYFDEKLTFNDFIFVNAGFRFSSFHVLPPGSVLIYNPEFSRSGSTVIDTLYFKKGNQIRHYAGPEFRLSVNFRTSEYSSLKLNYNHMRQYLHLLSNTTSISPTDTWKLSDYYLKPQIGDQYAIGFYRLLRDGKIETSAEIYYKQINNMVDFRNGTELIMNEHIEKNLAPVTGKAYGLELSVKKESGRTRWNVGYTYSRTFLRSTGTFSDEIINNGKWFPANFDKPNNLSITYTYLYSRRFSFSSNYTWSTGRPITYPITSYYIGNKLVVQYSDRNQFRIPDYARLDVSCTINGNLKSHKIANPHLTFSVYNLLGRENVYSVFFRNDKNIMYGYKLSIFGRAIPSVNFNFDF
jgi:hypothetical protein